MTETYRVETNAIAVPQVCGACRWWARRFESEGVGTGSDSSECRRHAPAPKELEPGYSSARLFPFTRWDDNCGDYELGLISQLVRVKMDDAAWAARMAEKERTTTVRPGEPFIGEGQLRP